MRKGHVLLLTLVLSLTLVTGAWAQDEVNQAALVVTFADGEVMTQCVAFETAEISGYDFLVESGLSLELDVGGLGSLVCSIEGKGCPASNCFCQCKGGDACEYWSYWHQLQDEWRYSQVGMSLYQVKPGAVEGWSWGPGSPNNAIAPPDLSFEDVCVAEEAIAAEVGDQEVAAEEGDQEVAATVVPAIDTSAPSSSVEEPTSAEVSSPSSRWVSYGVFAGIVLVLAIGWLAVSRQGQSG